MNWNLRILLVAISVMALLVGGVLALSGTKVAGLALLALSVVSMIAQVVGVLLTNVRRRMVDPAKSLRDEQSARVEHGLALNVEGSEHHIAVNWQPAAPDAGCPPVVASQTQLLKHSEGVALGREAEFDKLDRFLSASDGQVLYLTGPHGIGKTYLAQHWARSRCCGGGDPRNPSRAIYTRLGRLDVPDYRGLLDMLSSSTSFPRADRRDPDQFERAFHRRLYDYDRPGSGVLVIFDEVEEARQLRTMKVDYNHHRFVVISSRDVNSGAHRSWSLQLKELSADESLRVLRQCIDDRRFPEGADPDLTDPHLRKVIDRLCGGVPLLLYILAAALGRWGDGLDHLNVEEILKRSRDVGVASAFVEKITDAQLHGQERELWMLLASVPGGPPMTQVAVRELVDLPTREVAGVLDDLAERGLIARVGDGFAIHDLLRPTAERRAADLLRRERDAALLRLLRYYLRNAQEHSEAAGFVLLRHTRPGSRASSGQPPSQEEWLRRRQEALTWFRREQEGLRACLEWASEAADDDTNREYIYLASALAGCLRNDGPWPWAKEVHTTAAELAGRLGDAKLEAVARNDLAITLRLLKQLEDACRELQRARDAYRRVDDGQFRDLGLANVQNELGWVASQLEPSSANSKNAFEHHLKAWKLYKRVRDSMGQANAAKNLAVCCLRLDKRKAADRWRRRSLKRFDDGHDVLGPVELLNRFASELEDSDHTQASTSYAAARERLEKLGQPWGSPFELGKALAGLARCCVRDRKVDEALPLATHALDQLQRVGASDEISRLIKWFP